MEEVTWDDKQVTSKNWTTYDSLYLGFEIPIIDIILMNPRGVLATGRNCNHGRRRCNRERDLRCDWRPPAGSAIYCRTRQSGTYR